MANSFAWEKEYKRTWLEDKKLDSKNEYKINKLIYNDKKKGILRHLHILLDVSLSIDKNDYLPSIRKNIISSLEKFIPKFYLENPISGMSFSCVNDRTIKITNSTNVKDLLNRKGEGNFSLLNGLYGAVEHIKSYTFCKEIVVIVSSLVLKDSDSYSEIIDILKKLNIKINIISICGELMIYKHIVESTGGKLYVPLNIDHFDYILKSLTIPSEIKSATINLIKLGFPKVIYEEGVCACHLQMNLAGYECPACKTYICSLPMGCPICELQLVSSLNISKSYQHMYPLKLFIKCPEGTCIVCQKKGEECCGKCNSVYCDDCNFFVHENLNFCLGCKK
ncbi:general transcription and DNA repair factor IIH subunit (SSL1) [Vairimorpha necatrix]|uniref:General transcription and DNA repair factor IIH subunit (SSL1) n=1 Tax=Vairimorpha necatrix TaxID=6039 RepID=A0AAX4J8Z1_9MICR